MLEKDLQKLGVKVVAGDLQDKASLIAAYKGAHTVVYVPIPTAPLERIQATENALAAAQANKITRFLTVSFGNGRADSVNLLQSSYLHMEAATRALSAAGIHWLIVKMGLFAENMAEGYKAAVQSGVLSYPGRGDIRTPWISRKDIARGVAAATLRWDLHSKEYNLQGATAVSNDEVAALLSKLSGKKVAYRQLSIEDYGKVLAPSYGPAAAFFAAVYASFADAAERKEFAVNNDLYELTGETAERFEKTLAGLIAK